MPEDIPMEDKILCRYINLKEERERVNADFFDPLKGKFFYESPLDQAEIWILEPVEKNEDAQTARERVEVILYNDGRLSVWFKGYMKSFSDFDSRRGRSYYWDKRPEKLKDFWIDYGEALAKYLPESVRERLCAGWSDEDRKESADFFRRSA